MGINTHQNRYVSEIQNFLTEHLSNSSFDSDIISKSFQLLHTKGKIFNHQENHFSWGIFFVHITSLFDDKNISTRSIAAIGAAIELLILATDIVDEIIDDDKDLTKTMTLAEAIILANALLMDAFDLILKHMPENMHAAITKIFQHLKTACNGQWQDLKLTIEDSIPTEEKYFKIIQQKSASLIQLVCTLANPANPQLFSQIATNIGIAGQLKNDAKDIFTDAKTDIIHKKATLPIIKAIEYSLENDNGALIEKFQKLTKNNMKLIEEIRDYIHKTGALDYCIILSKLFIKNAINELYNIFPNKRAVLKAIEDYLQ